MLLPRSSLGWLLYGLGGTHFGGVLSTCLSSGVGCAAVLRLRFANDALIQHSKFLKPQTKAVGSIYYQEPFYQLMRQMLWAEQIIHQTFALVKPELQEEFDNKEQFRADVVLLLHIIPRANKYVVPKKFSQEPIEKLWRDQLINPESYQVIDPKDLFAPIAKDLDEHWLAYLEARYW